MGCQLGAQSAGTRASLLPVLSSGLLLLCFPPKTFLSQFPFLLLSDCDTKGSGFGESLRGDREIYMQIVSRERIFIKT